MIYLYQRDRYLACNLIFLLITPHLCQEQSESYKDETQEGLNGDADLANLSLDDQKPEMENVPINNSGTLPDTMEQVIFNLMNAFVVNLRGL